ncbi:30S ribosomal protein S13 [Candidatus Woesearchaeota archaeon]|nr:30S ribosomal protein S13 [Candidatus Woesearchaeota archaeon]
MADFKELIRVASTDIPGKKKLYYGLTNIHGISYSFSNALCLTLNLDKNRKIGSLNEKEIKDIETSISHPEKIPAWVRNRRKETETGADVHAIGSNLKLMQEFDVRRLKKIRSYRGMRHALGLPVRGQSTKAHFRHGKVVGVVKKATRVAAAKADTGKKDAGKK